MNCFFGEEMVSFQKTLKNEKCTIMYLGLVSYISDFYFFLVETKKIRSNRNSYLFLLALCLHHSNMYCSSVV